MYGTKEWHLFSSKQRDSHHGHTHHASEQCQQQSHCPFWAFSIKISMILRNVQKIKPTKQSGQHPQAQPCLPVPSGGFPRDRSSSPTQRSANCALAPASAASVSTRATSGPCTTRAGTGTPFAPAASLTGSTRSARKASRWTAARCAGSRSARRSACRLPSSSPSTTRTTLWTVASLLWSLLSCCRCSVRSGPLSGASMSITPGMLLSLRLL
ncbi:uncharacterized protein J3D65DRAFT_413908 [Phyllosticta citribraziliensis]|uniref:Uncharacterized protein n=1 Tax=Phyllosticta citribraziliensis TaxID=989973 RepID=A0ABR1LMB3_9PEZI